jgi:hypothetical protein
MSRINVEIYLGLIHYPIYNKRGSKITTTITNLDLHDIARVAKTYNVEKYYVVNPLKSQQELVKRMIRYWTSEYGAKYNENRKESFSVIDLALSLSEVISDIEEKCGKRVKIIATDAKIFPYSVSYSKMREIISESDGPFLILFGTGWGLTEETLEKCDYILYPIFGRGNFNHLSVRSAASIILDRLLSDEFYT